MARDYMSPGISYKETEELASRISVYSPYVAIIGGASKGPSVITEVKTQKELKKLFGGALDTDFGVFAADYILEQNCRVLYKRVMGEDASQGTAGTSTDKFTFKSRWYDSSLNGAVVEVTFDKTAETLEYKLTKGTTVLEHYKGLSYTDGDPKYLPDFLDSIGSVLEATESTGVTGEGIQDLELTLEGIDDGIDSLAAADYEDAVEEFSNVETTTLSILIVPGVSDTDVIEACAALVKERGDCVYIPDIPFGTTSATALTFANEVDAGQFRLDNEWVGLYGPWVKVTDVTRSKTVWAPPSVVATAVMVKSEAITGGCYVAAAGFSDGRGVVPHAVECEYDLTKEERDSWLGNGNVLNPIAHFKGLGIAVFGNKTTKRTPDYEEESVFCSMNIRRLANYIRQLVIRVSMTELFNPNDSLTWASWKAKLNPLLKEIKDGRGIEDYKIVMDETTVTEDDVRMGKAPAIIYVKPIRALEYIPITFAVTENGVIFDNGEEV